MDLRRRPRPGNFLRLTETEPEARRAGGPESRRPGEPEARRAGGPESRRPGEPEARRAEPGDNSEPGVDVRGNPLSPPRTEICS